MYGKILNTMFVLALVLASCTPAAVPTPSPTPFPDPFQEKVTVGNYTIPIWCQGSGEPTIILEPDVYFDSLNMNALPRFKKITRTCYYERVGRSGEKIDAARTTRDQVQELHALLEQTGVPGPYILVGFHISGYNLILYTAQYPKEVAGLVCVECMHSKYFDYWYAEMEAEPIEDAASKKVFWDEITDYKAKKIYLWDSNPEKLDQQASDAQVLEIKSLDDTPLVIVQAENGFEPSWIPDPQVFAFLNRTKHKSQEDFCRLSSNCRIEKVPIQSLLTIFGDGSVDKAVQEIYDQVEK